MQTSVTDLTPEHFTVLNRAMLNTLSTSLAFETYAQVIDGMPISAIYLEYYGSCRDDFSSHREPSLEARQAVEAFRDNFTIDMVRINPKLAQFYQNTSINSREFILRLVEIVVTLCHDIAATLSLNADGGINKPTPRSPRRYPLPEPPNGVELVLNTPLKPTALFHPGYQDWDQYPRGVADMVGYWAEYRLFGGVVLFDRGTSGTECNDIFIDPVGGYRIFQLSEAQVQQFAEFLLSGAPKNDATPSGLRFTAEKSARRIDPYDAMFLHIYRDKYERKIPPYRPVQCVRRGDDDPEYAEAFADFVNRTGDRH